MEDTETYKKSQEEAAAALKAMQARDETEKELLLQSLRAHSIQSAFQQDTELAIQKSCEAAAETILLQHQLRSANEARAQSLEAAQAISSKDDEQDRYTGVVGKYERELNELKEMLRKQESILRLQEEQDSDKYRALEDTIKANSRELESLRGSLQEERQTRRELETEVNVLLQNRQKLLSDLEASLAAKASEEMSESVRRAEALEGQVQLSQEALQRAGAEIDSHNQQLSSRMALKDEVAKLRRDNQRLKASLVEIKRSAGLVRSQKTPSDDKSLSSPAVATKLRSLRELLSACAAGLQESSLAESNQVVEIVRSRKRASEVY